MTIKQLEKLLLPKETIFNDLKCESKAKYKRPCLGPLAPLDTGDFCCLECEKIYLRLEKLNDPRVLKLKKVRVLPTKEEYEQGNE